VGMKLKVKSEDVTGGDSGDEIKNMVTCVGC